MKRFLDFLSEALETSASTQAKRLGLIGNGHGDWYDRQGNLVAKTVKGQLKVFSGKKSEKKSKDEGDRKSETSSKYMSSRGGSSTAKSGQSEVSKKLKDIAARSKEAESPRRMQIPQRKDTVSIAFGKFNPPSKDHIKLFKTLEKASSGGEFYIFPSRTQDGKRNPLDPELKIAYMREMFPEYAEVIMDDDNFRTIFDVLTFLNQKGYTSVNIVAGDERVAEIESLTAKANGEKYQYQSMNVISSGTKESESQSSIAREAALSGDAEIFMRTMPEGMDEKVMKSLYDDLRKSMSSEESYTWEISPELNWKNLRENYILGKIFKVGTIVENCNTGLRGEIIRSGANHLICVTEDGVMFKSWIKDVCECRL